MAAISDVGEPDDAVVDATSVEDCVWGAHAAGASAVKATPQPKANFKREKRVGRDMISS
jgi:hypothetical protein